MVLILLRTIAYFFQYQTMIPVVRGEVYALPQTPPRILPWLRIRFAESITQLLMSYLLLQPVFAGIHLDYYFITLFCICQGFFQKKFRKIFQKWICFLWYSCQKSIDILTEICYNNIVQKCWNTGKNLIFSKWFVRWKTW